MKNIFLQGQQETDLQLFQTINGQWVAVEPVNNSLGSEYYQGINFGFSPDDYVVLVNGLGSNDLYFGRWQKKWLGWNKFWHSNNLNRKDADFVAKIISCEKIGIGTDNPNGQLHVGKQETPAGTEGSIVRLVLQPYGHVTGPWSFVCRDTNMNAFLDVNYGSRSIFSFLHSGNIGIGTNSPNGQLHIGKQETPAGAEGSIVRLVLQPYGHVTGPWNFICRDTNMNAFLDVNYGSRPVFSFLHSGNVGIGTNNPQYKLDVNGTINAQEIKVNHKSLHVPDYVFEDDYQLCPLSELENFVTTHKHLPDIPPAENMEKNGVAIGELQIKLLQKIEELTLYAIEQDKRIKNLEMKMGNVLS